MLTLRLLTLGYVGLEAYNCHLKIEFFTEFDGENYNIHPNMPSLAVKLEYDDDANSPFYCGFTVRGIDRQRQYLIGLAGRRFYFSHIRNLRHFHTEQPLSKEEIIQYFL